MTDEPVTATAAALPSCPDCGMLLVSYYRRGSSTGPTLHTGRLNRGRYEMTPDDVAWERSVHDAPFGHCAKCGQDLPIHTGGDGKVIVSAGFCPDCDVMTVWEVVDAT